MFNSIASKLWSTAAPNNGDASPLSFCWHHLGGDRRLAKGVGGGSGSGGKDRVIHSSCPYPCTISRLTPKNPLKLAFGTTKKPKKNFKVTQPTRNSCRFWSLKTHILRGHHWMWQPESSKKKKVTESPWLVGQLREIAHCQTQCRLGPRKPYIN